MAYQLVLTLGIDSANFVYENFGLALGNCILLDLTAKELDLDRNVVEFEHKTSPLITASIFSPTGESIPEGFHDFIKKEINNG